MKRKRPENKNKINDIVAETPKKVNFRFNINIFKEVPKEVFERLENDFRVKIETKTNVAFISGEIKNSRKVACILEKIHDWVDNEYEVAIDDVQELIEEYNEVSTFDTKYKYLFTTFDGKPISPRTKNQELIVDTILNKQISVIGGVAGGGKTFFSILMGLKFIEDGRFDNMIICRPLVSVGGKDDIGFLPGELDQKIFPYNSVIYNCLDLILGEATVQAYIKEKKIIFSPISFMRGSTLNSYIVLDETQNISLLELKTLMTRLGLTSKLVCTGDISQKDIKSNTNSLEFLEQKLKGMDYIGFVKMVKADIQRNKIVGDIIDAFE